MNRTVTQIREMNKIEKELSSCLAGVLAFHTTGDEVVQVPCTFLYYHKNIYATFQEDDDILEKITYDTSVSFAVIIGENLKRKKKQEINYLSKIFSVTLTGTLKRPEEVKISDTIRELYSLKYSGKKKTGEEADKLFFILFDTSEIKAVEEVIE